MIGRRRDLRLVLRPFGLTPNTAMTPQDVVVHRFEILFKNLAIVSIIVPVAHFCLFSLKPLLSHVALKLSVKASFIYISDAFSLIYR